MLVLSRICHIFKKRALEVTPHVYQLTIRGVNIILIVEEELTLIDTGFRGSSPKIISFIHSLGRSPEEVSLIILTHNHPDHTGGLAELKRLIPARVAAHKADISNAGAGGELTYPNANQRPVTNPLFSTLHSLFSIKPNEVDIQLEGGEVLKPLGGLKVIHTPGHTPGSISLFSPQEQLLIVGDTINTRRKNLQLPPKMVSNNLRQAVDSVKGLARLNFNSLCCGHGRPLNTNAHNKVEELVKRNTRIDNIP